MGRSPWTATLQAGLAGIGLASLVGIGRGFWAPYAHRPQPFSPPEPPPLANWQAQSTQLPLPQRPKDLCGDLGGTRYQYRQGQETLDARVVYIVGVSVQQPLNRLITRYGITERIKAKNLRFTEQSQARGPYARFIYRNTAHLSACLDPAGRTTVTAEQFWRNRLQADLLPLPILAWLVGRPALLDKRCLWTQLALPLGNQSPAIAYRRLEALWPGWLDWWAKHYPPQ